MRLSNAKVAVNTLNIMSELKEIKQKFFLFRNGVISDTLRRGGMPYKVIFGIEIPRIAEIARSLTPSKELADTLWSDRDVRESRLLATYLYPIAELSEEDCVDLAKSTRTVEECDMLAFRIFKRLENPVQLLKVLRENALSADTEEDQEALKRSASALERHLE